MLSGIVRVRLVLLVVGEVVDKDTGVYGNIVD
jgi:hypothetical protein